MAYCKCYTLPDQGNFEVGKYYIWYYSAQANSGQKGKMVRDMDKQNINFSSEEYSLYFNDIECADNSIDIYIDRKKELIFTPILKFETGFHVSAEYFSRLPAPYTKETIGKEFYEVWKKYYDHPVVTDEERKQITPYYKIIAKSWSAFASRRYMLSVEFIPSEEEIMFTYWYRKERNSFGLNADDKVINRVIPMSASFEEIGHTVLRLYEKAGVI